MPRTVQEVALATGPTETRERILRSLQSHGFEILPQSSTGQPIDYPFRSFHARLATHPGSIVAIQAKWSGFIVFELDVLPRDAWSLLHGEFYVAGAGGGVVDYLGQEMDVLEKPPMVGRIPRKKGFKVMKEFLSDLGT